MASDCSFIRALVLIHVGRVHSAVPYGSLSCEEPTQTPYGVGLGLDQIPRPDMIPLNLVFLYLPSH